MTSLHSFEELKEKSANIHFCLIEKNQTLALAESCTGGLLSYCLTRQPKASMFFLGSIVSYSYSSKVKHLGVTDSLLNQKGAVNEAVCLLMAQGVKNRWESDWVLAITGVAGPGKMPKDPPVGTVFVSVLGPKCQKVEQILLNGKNRQDIRHQSAIFALDFLYSCITMGTHQKEEEKNYE